MNVFRTIAFFLIAGGLAAAATVSFGMEGRSADSSHAVEPGKVWRSEELDMLAIGMAVGDVDGDGKNEIVVIDPSRVYVYRPVSGRLDLLAEYSSGNLELKCVDVAKIRKQGPARIYVTAQNRGTVESFVLEYRNGALDPVIRGIPYFLRVIVYPTHGPILLGQKKGLRKMYEGPVYRLDDKGDALDAQGRFGIPLKIPIFGFAVGDFVGNHKPLIAVYDRYDHLRIYTPAGKRLYVTREYYGGSDVILRWAGPEKQHGSAGMDDDNEVVFFRPRIVSLDLDGNGVYEILASKHHSKTMRMMSRTKMLEEGQVVGLLWNGDVLEDLWSTPKIQGMVTDFAVDTLPGFSGRRLITLERMKTDWLAFLRSKSRLRAYDLDKIIGEGKEGGGREE
ncbi:MAG: VCBS repeat-containing protein [Desulfomonilaceae bacterium]|nr:VCBS repeat-containing protein [Desulfomonilaceae bacterium]